MGSVQLVHGDIFSGPSDLVVLPCAVSGSITHFVRERLTTFSIPSPRPAPLGTVQIMTLPAAENLAPLAAFATSEQRRQSDPAAIERIGRGLGEATRTRPDVQIVAAPLLGAGAGGLTAEVTVERLRAGFRATASPEAALKIYVRREDVYRRLRKDADPAPPLRVFVSYTATGDDERDWIRGLATFLRRNGVNARCDLWLLRHGMQFAQWMSNELDLADRVLLVCTEAYAQRADRLHGGVGFEFMLVLGDIYRHRDTTKYVPIVRTADPAKGLPFFLQTYFAIHWPPGADENARQADLLRTLRHTQEQEPPLTGVLR